MCSHGSPDSRFERHAEELIKPSFPPLGEMPFGSHAIWVRPRAFTFEYPFMFHRVFLPIA